MSSINLTAIDERRLFRLGLALFVIAFGQGLSGARQNMTAQVSPVALVSAASYAPTLAPNAVAVAFGQNLAARTESATTLPLPTNLAGATVKVNGRLAGLFFVAPTQINLLVPEETAPGIATVEVFINDNKVAQGQMQVNRNAPAIFTANANGKGVPAAGALRVAADGGRSNELVAQFDQASREFVPKPIELGAEGDQVFLILFLSGVRGAGNAARIFIGGRPIDSETVLYVGPAPGFAGLDQINLRLPRTLRGRVKLLVEIDNALPSNVVELEIVPPSGTAPPRVTAFSKARVLAGERVEITGAGFTPDSVVHIGGVRTAVIEASSSRLLIEVPFGVRAGKISVLTPGGEAASPSELAVRSSISGFITDTARVPLRGVTVTAEIRGGRIKSTTGDNGSFVLPDMPVTAENPTANADIYIDTSTITSTLNYPRVSLKKRIAFNQDNQLDAPVALQLVNGPGTAPNTLADALGGTGRAAIRQAQTQAPIRLETNGFALEIPAGATIRFPGNTQPGPINLTLVDGVRDQNDLKQSRLPANLPPGIFSPKVIQITPLGATVNPGARLAFPNTDGQTPGATVKFYRLEQNPASENLGQFIESGEARISDDGKKVETLNEAIKEFSYYFTAAPQTTTVVIGRVVEDAGPGQPARPVQQAIAQTRGQGDFTDGSGGFAPRDVPTKQGDSLQVSAIYLRSNGRVDYADKLISAKVNGVTDAGMLPLPPQNRNQPPVLLTPPSVTLNPGETRDVKFTAYDPDPNQTITVNTSLIPQSPDSNQNPTFSRIFLNQSGEHTARFTPGVNDIGEYALEISVVDNNSEPARLTRFIAVTVQGRPGAFTISQPDVVCDTSLPSGPAVRLIWLPSPLATAYDVYRNEMLIAQGLIGASFMGKGVTAGASYSYRMTARNAVGARDANPVTVTVPGNICASAQVTVSLGQVTGNATTGGTITIPVLLGDVTGRSVIAYEFDLAFDPAVLQFQELDISGTLSSTMTVAHNPNTPGKLRVAAFGAHALAGPGRILLQLKFRVVGARDTTSTLVWEKFMLNEGDPPSNRVTGSFTVN